MMAFGYLYHIYFYGWRNFKKAGFRFRLYGKHLEMELHFQM